jgi:porin
MRGAWVVCGILTALVSLTAAMPAFAGAKDETSAEWIPFVPPSVTKWRDDLANKGLSFGWTYIGDTIGNVSGGFKRGTIYQGRLDIGVDADLEKLTGWTGARIHANVFQIHGRGLTHSNIGNIAPVSEIEALPDTRLYEAYLEQSFGDKFSLKVGQQAADTEFFDSKTDDLFVNGTFGWPAIKASNLPAGGPAPPIAVMGARLKAQLADNVTAFAAIFNGNPSRPGPGDPQLRDNHGLAFRVKDSPWLIGQVQFDYSIGQSGLPGSFTPGAWYHTGEFDDQRTSLEGLSRADPAGSGMPRKLRGNYGLFGVLEQSLYRSSGSKDKLGTDSAGNTAVTAFVRAAYSPPDRNLIDVYVDSGIQFQGFVPGRPLDRFGMAVAYMGISGSARGLDRDVQVFTGTPSPLRSFEGLLEVIYEAHIRPGWLMAPYFQYIYRPSGGVPSPTDPTGIAKIGNAAVFGLTNTIKF